MLRALLRSSRVRVHTVAPAVRFTPYATPKFVRLQSTTPKPPLTEQQAAVKAAVEKNDDLQRDWDARIVTYEELKPRTESPTADSYLIDVREPDEVIQGMIPSAVNLPLSGLATALQLEPSAFREKYGFNKPDHPQEVTFYCRSGVRSSSASDVAKRNGYTNIMNYRGSWLEWVEKENKKSP